MSVTFSTLNPSTGNLGPKCGADHSGCVTPDDPYCANSVADFGRCIHCEGDVANDCDVCSLTVNVSSDNAVAVLYALGYVGGEPGEADAADFRARTVTGAVTVDDTGIGAVVTATVLSDTTTDCGRRAGYFADTLGRLDNLAGWATAHGHIITWI